MAGKRYLVVGRAAAAAFGLARARRWSLLIVGLAYWGNVVRTGVRPGADGLALVTGGVLENGAFCAAAWAMLAGLAWRDDADGSCGRRELAWLAAACGVSAVPARQAAAVAMLLLGWRFARAGGRAASAGAWLLFGLAFESVWTSPALLPLHAAVGRLDAAIVVSGLAGAGIAATHAGNLVHNVVADFDIEILAPCASSFPLAAVALAFAVTRIFLGGLPGGRDLAWLAVSFLASFVLTQGRLMLMTFGSAWYGWLHEGGGVTLYTIAASFLAVLFPVLAGASPARRRAVA